MLAVTKHSLLTLSVLLICVLCIRNGYALEKQEAPLLIPGTVKIEAKDIFTLASNIPDLVIIDSRISSDRNHGYIDGSISLPDTDTSCTTLANKLASQTSPVLFYCNGVKCKRSVNAIKIALDCGYTNIYWFRGGFEEWIANDLPFIKQ